MRATQRLPASRALAAALLLFACAPMNGTGDGGPAETGPVCTEPSPIACRDTLVEALQLQSGDPSPQDITNEPDGDGFLSHVDATAGELVTSPRQSYLYARFIDEGLVKVPLDEEEALESMDWDIAFHRYILRLNGGSSGPSCVAATKVAGEYDEVTGVPAGPPSSPTTKPTPSAASAPTRRRAIRPTSAIGGRRSAVTTSTTDA